MKCETDSKNMDVHQMTNIDSGDEIMWMENAVPEEIIPKPGECELRVALTSPSEDDTRLDEPGDNEVDKGPGSPEEINNA